MSDVTGGSLPHRSDLLYALCAAIDEARMPLYPENPDEWVLTDASRLGTDQITLTVRHRSGIEATAKLTLTREVSL